MFGIILGCLWRGNSLRSVLAFGPKSGCFADTSESLQSLRERMQAIQREASRRERELIKSETQVCPLTTLSTHPSHGNVDGRCDLQFHSAQGKQVVQSCRDPIGGGEDSCTGGRPPSTHIVFPHPLDDTNTGMRKRPILALNESGNQTHVSLEMRESGWAHHFWGESFLHSPTIHCYTNACATHYPQSTI